MCPTKETLARYMRGALPPEEAADLEQHMAQCTACALLFGLAAEAALPETEVPAGFEARVMELLPPLPALKKRPILLRYAAAAGIALVLWQSGAFQALTEFPAKAEQFSAQVAQAVEIGRTAHEASPKLSLGARLDALLRQALEPDDETPKTKPSNHP